MTSNGRKKRVVIGGATGYLGRYLVKCAHARGFIVRALVRSKERLGDAGEQCDEVFVGEATRAETLKGLCDGADFVVTSLGNRTLARKPDCFDVDYRGNMNILGRALEAGVSQFVFISVLKGAEARKIVPQFEARERVVDALKAGALPWTIIRPSGFFNDMSEIMDMAKKGRIWIPGGAALFNPIHGADLAEVCIDAVGNPSSMGREINAGGPDVFTMRAIGELAFEALGKPTRIGTVPSWVLSLAGAVIRPFNINLASLILMMSMFPVMGIPCDAYGTHRLRNFFIKIANTDNNELAARR